MTPDFKHQLIGTLRLLADILEHGNESDQADAAREHLDNGSWHRLDALERHRIGSLSAMVAQWERWERKNDDQPV